MSGLGNKIGALDDGFVRGFRLTSQLNSDDSALLSIVQSKPPLVHPLSK